jgi:nitrile hydratase accessory protein
MPICGSLILKLFDDVPVFGAPWEAEAFAMAVTLHERGVYSWAEWAQTLAAQIQSQPDCPYYESWLAALEKLVEANSLITPDERQARIDAWDRAAKATPHGKPIELGNTST